MANKNQQRATDRKASKAPNEPKEKQWVNPKDRTDQRDAADRQKMKSHR